MDSFILHRSRLSGSVDIGGSKNASLPILFGSLLATDTVHLSNVPDISDVRMVLDLFKRFNVCISGNLVINPVDLQFSESDVVGNIHYTILLLGCLLPRIGHIRIPIPGGCVLGKRKFDIHLDGLRALGATIVTDKNFITGTADKLYGTTYTMRLPSVSATENIILAACQATGTTIIKNASTYPEVIDFINFLNSFGASIEILSDRDIVVNESLPLSGGAYSVV